MDDLHRVRMLIKQDTINDDIIYFDGYLTDNFKFYNNLSSIRKSAIISLCCLYGVKKLIEKTNLLLALESSDFERAYFEILKDSDKHKKIAEVIKTDMLDMI